MIILITGTRKGIGRYLAEYYLKKGYTIIGCSRKETDLKHEKYDHFITDITKEEEVKKLFVYVKKKYNKIDMLINNAGIASMNHFLLTPYETMQKIIDINFLGTALMCRTFARLILKSEHGRIINFTTVASPLELEGEAVYASSKSAVETLTKILAKELAAYNITVNAIGPTPIKTDLIKGVTEQKLEKLIQKQTIKRYGKLEDVLNVVDFFSRPDSDFITGQIIYLGGIS